MTTMYRRKAGEGLGPPLSIGASPKPQVSASASAAGRHGAAAAGARRSADSRLSPPVILTITCFILFGSIVLLSIISPSSVQSAEDQILQAERIVEDEVSEFFGGGVHEKVVPPVPHDGVQRRDRSIDATDAMLKQDSSWVDGEKKLKKKLKLLAERQAQGKDLGVPVLTRWLGDDIPAWAGEGVDVEEWRKKVDAKYVEMREEENTWREKVAQFIVQ